MREFSEMVAAGEGRLTQRVLDYARQHGYTRHTSSLLEAWRASVAGLSRAMLRALADEDGLPRLSADIDYAVHPVAAFGVLEARLHRGRGISLGLFLGLTKHYRQAYLDLIDEAGLEQARRAEYADYVRRFFDAVELGFCVEWNSHTRDDLLEELRRTNVALTDEKTSYLAAFESIPCAVVLLDRECGTRNMNQAAADLLGGAGTPGVGYYGMEPGGVDLGWLQPELGDFVAGNASQHTFEKGLETASGRRHFRVGLKRALDLRDSRGGTIVMLDDVTAQKQVSLVQGAAHAISEATHVAGDVRELFRFLFGVIAGVIPADSLSIFLCDPESGDLDLAYLVDRRGIMDEPPVCGLDVARYLFQARRPLRASRESLAGLAGDLGLEPPDVPWSSCLAVPLEGHDRPIGLLALHSHDAGCSYTEEQLELLAFLALQVAIAVERKQAEDDRERLIGELRAALAQVKTLSGLLPMCASCKKVRDDAGYWNQIEAYIESHSEAEFSHGICPDCLTKLYPTYFPAEERGNGGGAPHVESACSGAGRAPAQ